MVESLLLSALFILTLVNFLYVRETRREIITVLSSMIVESRRLLEAINLRVGGEAIATRTSLDVLAREQQSTQLISSHALSAICQLRGVLEGADQRLDTFHAEIQAMPKLTFTTLRTWEAVTFSCQKAARDQELQRNGDVSAEELLWSAHYLEEQGWEHPGVEVVSEMIALRHLLESSKKVQA